MALHLPVRRFLQDTEKTATPQIRFGATQWVLSRPLYRFQTFDLAQVPANNRAQALRLELSQWTPFPNSDYYIGWHAQQALVWCWNADQVSPAIAAQKLKPQRVRILPESVLHAALQNGLCLTQCQQGYEGQLWCEQKLTRSRWWPQLPTQGEWLMFQRDAGIPPGEQQEQLPSARAGTLLDQPWVSEVGSASDKALQMERLIVALGALILLLPTFWYGFSLLKLQHSAAALAEQKAELRQKTEPITQARNQVLDHLTRIDALLALAPYPEQLALMATLADILPADKAYIKQWDYRQGQLKFTLSSPNDIAATHLIGILQQAGPFNNVKALPGQDPKSITLQLDVIGKRA